MIIEDLSGSVGQPIDIETFVSHAEAQFDPYDRDSIWEMRAPLVALALNKQALFSAIKAALIQRLESHWAREQPSYFVLHVAETFGLRANIWLPERRTRKDSVLENAAFSYDYPHDHNFDILTTTCLGPGYYTQLYNYDEIADTAGIGTIVDIVSLGKRQITPGTVFYYEACRDVHTQLPVDEITVTLNFLPLRRDDHKRPQYVFEDIGNNQLKILGVPMSPEGREMSAIRMLSKLEDYQAITGNALNNISMNAENRRVANYASKKADILKSGRAAANDELVHELEVTNAAFKYHEIANISRGST